MPRVVPICGWRNSQRIRCPGQCVCALQDGAKCCARLITPPVWRGLSGLPGRFAACGIHCVLTAHGTQDVRRLPMTAWHMPRLVIAAPHSHSGKTTVTIALLAALRQRGLRVAPFKVGPDYIDPQLHRQAAGGTRYNLDTYLVPAGQVQETFYRVAHEADIAIVEGVMGLFDGSSPTSRVGSTAQVAVLLQAPIVLVIDASGMAASVGALIHGFRTYDPEVCVAGVVLNRLGSAGHMRYLVPAIEREGVEILGYLPKDATLTIPERHLGLLPTAEEDRVTPLLGHLTTLARRYIDLDRVLQLAHTAPALPPGPRSRPGPAEAVIRVAWAHDEAFHFSYQENRDLLAAAGADIVPFSPLHDEA